MKIVITDIESIPEWLYPGSFDDLETPAGDSLATDLDASDFSRLSQVLGKTGDAVQWQSFSEVGIPHDAPDHVESLHPDLLADLLAVPAHERWRVAEEWASADGKRPNKERLASTKKLLNSLCELAERAIASGKLLVLIPDGFGHGESGAPGP